MNVKFTYMYRCGGNFKQGKEVVFRNPGKIALPILQQKLAESLLDGKWFFAYHVGVPELFFDEEEYDHELDHDRHEFVSLEEVRTAATDTKNRTILQFVNSIHMSIFRFKAQKTLLYYPRYVQNQIRRTIAGVSW